MTLEIDQYLLHTCTHTHTHTHTHAIILFLCRSQSYNCLRLMGFEFLLAAVQHLKENSIINRIALLLGRTFVKLPVASTGSCDIKSYNGHTKNEHPYATDSKNCVKLVSVESLSLNIFTHAIKSIQALGLYSSTETFFYLSTYEFFIGKTVTALSLKTSVGWM